MKLKSNKWVLVGALIFIGLVLWNKFVIPLPLTIPLALDTWDILSGKGEISKTYISPLGFSFEYPQSLKIKEYSYDIDKLKDLTSNSKNGEIIDLPTSKTTRDSLGTDLRTMSSPYAVGPITLEVAKIDKIGTLPKEITSKVRYNESLFAILSSKEYFNEVTNLIKRRVDFKEAVYFGEFNGQGQNKRYSPHYFSTSNLYGFTNFVAGGFSYPLGLYKEYYLFDKNDKYFFRIYFNLSCKEKTQLDEKLNKSSFDTNDTKNYVRTLISISEECERNTKDKADFDLLLNSLKLVD